MGSAFPHQGVEPLSRHITYPILVLFTVKCDYVVIVFMFVLIILILNKDRKQESTMLSLTNSDV